jgi:copper(I)-binding protein
MQFGLPRYHFRMNKRPSTSRRLALICALGLAPLAQHASALLAINQPWVRPAQQQQTTEAYMNITSTDGAALVGAVSAAASRVVIRGPGKSAGDLARLPLPAQNIVVLAPGQYRLVLHRLTRTLKLGDRVPLTLTIEAADGSRQDVGVSADVRLHSPVDDDMHAHQHAH